MADTRDSLFNGQTSVGKPVRRPMSPHLQVYKPQLTSVLSIANRLSAIAISAGTLLMVWWLVAASQGPRAFAGVQWFASSIVGIAVLVGWTLALTYHLFGGLRHLCWDVGIGDDLTTVHRTGWLAVGATVLFTALIVGAGLAAWL